MNGYESTCRLSQLVKVKWNNDDFCFTGKVIDAEENAFNRQMINRQINNILNGAGINISDEDNILLIGNSTAICISAKDIPLISKTGLGNILIKNNRVISITKI